jgi:hypothetical protein
LVPSDRLAALFRLIGALAAPSPNSTFVLDAGLVKRAKRNGEPVPVQLGS